MQTNVPLIHQVVVGPARGRPPGHALDEDPRRGPRRWPQAVPQKGTGRARQGSTRAPQFAGGGVVHGPQPRDYSQRTPKKMKAAALRGALSDRARHGRIHVVDVARRRATPRRPRPRPRCSTGWPTATQRARRARPQRPGVAEVGAQPGRACTSWPSTSSTPTTCCAPTTSSSPQAALERVRGRRQAATSRRRGRAEGRRAKALTPAEAAKQAPRPRPRQEDESEPARTPATS